MSKEPYMTVHMSPGAEKKVKLMAALSELGLAALKEIQGRGAPWADTDVIVDTDGYRCRRCGLVEPSGEPGMTDARFSELGRLAADKHRGCVQVRYIVAPTYASFRVERRRRQLKPNDVTYIGPDFNVWLRYFKRGEVAYIERHELHPGLVSIRCEIERRTRDY